VAGQLDDNEMDVVWRGLKKSDAIRKIGGDPTRLAEARRPAEFFKAYLELHIEQGGNLERAAIPVGIVEGIVAIDDFTIDIKGIANHAGTTPMPDRHDALIAASKLTIAVNEIVKAKPGRQVGTVGELVVEPNARNVVPGHVRMTAEFRDLSESKLDEMGAALRERVKAIAAETGTTIDLQANNRHKAALATPALQEAIGNAASKSGLKTMRLPSGAGHDAQMMARLGPMGMIFVPSIAGISHSPKELTTWEDCARGAQILLDAVLSLAL
jgi:N-carbamoyl-L-amino-acid hydrolase